MKAYFLKSIGIFFLGCTLFFTSCKTTKNNAPTEAVWQEVKAVDGSLPVARHEAAFKRVKDKFYLMGGRKIRPISIYDTKTQKWTEGAKPPIEIHHFQPVVYKDKIYIVGAMTGGYPGETGLENIYIYDPSTDAWSVGDKVPEDRLRGSTGNVVVGDKIYISCGIKDGHRSDHKKWMDSYDLITGKWEVLPDAPNARDHFQSAYIDGKIYNTAGRLSKARAETFKHTIAKIDVYDIATKTWKTLDTDLPTPRAGNMVTVSGNEVWVVGGESEGQEEAHNQVEALNVLTNTWRRLPNLIRGRHGAGIAEYNGVYYIASGSGGKGGGPELQSMEKFGAR